MCCHEKEFNDEGMIFIDLDKPCQFLDSCNNRCTIYDTRFLENKNCKKLTLYQALFNPYLPSSCGYVKKIRFWKRKNNG